MISLDCRREARDAVRHMGKFEGESPLTPILWQMYLDGATDEDCGHIIRIGRWTLTQDDQGFVYGMRHATADDAEDFVADCEACHAEEMEI